MPSQKVLEQKKAIVSELAGQIKGAISGVLVDYSGINVADDTKLRAQLREAGVHYAVVKNTLTKLALKEAELEGLDDVLNGTTAIAMSETDLIAPAKILHEFSKDHENFTLKGGFMEGKVLSLDEVNKIAQLPSKETLLTMLCIALNGNISGLARALNAVVEQKNEATPA